MKIREIRDFKVISRDSAARAAIKISDTSAAVWTACDGDSFAGILTGRKTRGQTVPMLASAGSSDGDP